MLISLQCDACGTTQEVTESEANAPLRCPKCQSLMNRSEVGALRSSAPRGGLTPLKIWLSILLLALAAYGGFTAWRIVSLWRAEQIANSTAPSVWLEQTDFVVDDFQLIERSGRTFSPRELRGQVWVASFFFAQCGGACRTMNYRIAELLKGDLADAPVKFVSFTVDPEHDTPAALAAHADDLYIRPHKIDPKRWLFLTSPQGSTEAMRVVSELSFKLPFAKITHSSKLVLVDADGRVRGYYASEKDVDIERMKKRIAELLKEAAGKKQQPAKKDAA
jgi:protein SCO1/2